MTATSLAQTPRLAVLGAGHVGPVIVRLALKAAYPVAIATSGNPEDIAWITEAGHSWRPASAGQRRGGGRGHRGARNTAAPFRKPLPSLLDGKLVVERRMNHRPASDGVLRAFEHGGSSEIVAERLGGLTVVKALNHIGLSRPRGPRAAGGAPDCGRPRGGVTTPQRSPRSRS